MKTQRDSHLRSPATAEIPLKLLDDLRKKAAKVQPAILTFILTLELLKIEKRGFAPILLVESEVGSAHGNRTRYMSVVLLR